MPPLWWVLQAATLAALLAGTLLAFASSGRVGRHTQYGGILFVLALGMWFVFTGLTAYVATIAVDAWHGPPGWGDIFTLSGWTLVVAPFFILLHRFPSPGRPTDGPSPILLVPIAGGLLLGAIALYVMTGLARPPDAEQTVRTSYLFLDGVLITVFIQSSGVLKRLRRASLAQMYILLGVALLIKSLGDVVYLIWPRDPPIGLWAVALYPISGLIAVGALAQHHHAVAPMAERQVLADPGFVEPQLVLRDAARAIRGLAGDLGERLVLNTGARSLQDAGIAAVVRNGVVVARAPPAAWQAALTDARARAVAVLGEPAGSLFDDAWATFQRPGGPT